MSYVVGDGPLDRAGSAQVWRVEDSLIKMDARAVASVAVSSPSKFATNAMPGITVVARVGLQAGAGVFTLAVLSFARRVHIHINTEVNRRASPTDRISIY